MKKIVVTGATSFIGVHLIEQLLSDGNEVYAVVRPKSSNISRLNAHISRLNAHNNLRIVENEISDIADLPRQLPEKIDVFYHLAWEGARLPYRDDSVMQKKNYDAAVTAMEIAASLDCKCFIGAGSQAEYGVNVPHINEEYECKPQTEYGKAKLQACNTLASLAKEKKMRFIWPRIFSIYGKYDYAGTLIMSSIEKMKNGEEVKMTACTQMWDYLHVEDVADILIRFQETDCDSGIYNLASGNARPLKEFIEEIKSILNSKSVLEYGAVPYGPNGPVSLQPDVSKLKRALDWTPSVSFSQGIKKIIS